MRKKALAVALALIAALAALTIAGCSCSAQSSSSASSSMSASDKSFSASSSVQVEVPNVVWLEKKDAEAQLKKAGLEMGDVTKDYSDSVPEGLVISQKPEALAKADAGTKVALVISKGKESPNETTVPNLIGMSQTDAEKAISDAGLVAVQADPGWSAGSPSMRAPRSTRAPKSPSPPPSPTTTSKCPIVWVSRTRAQSTR